MSMKLLCIKMHIAGHTLNHISVAYRPTNVAPSHLQVVVAQDRARERIIALEATAKSADLQQAVECASFWTEQLDMVTIQGLMLIPDEWFVSSANPRFESTKDDERAEQLEVAHKQASKHWVPQNWVCCTFRWDPGPTCLAKLM